MGAIDIEKIKLTDSEKEVYKEARSSLNKHGQAAIHLVTSGGKTYIAAALIKELKGTNSKYNILFISSSNACNNAMVNFDSQYFKESINYITLNKLQRDTKYIDKLNIKKVNLIIFDEAHRVLAEQTYKGVQYILNKYPKAKIIAMSANHIRHDKKSVFGWLTPKLELDIDYKDRGLQYAIKNDLICDFIYKTCDIKMLRDYNAYMQPLRKYSDFNNELNELSIMLDDFDKNTYTKLAKSISNDLVQYKYSASTGNRWFVFYNKIEDIKENVSNIENMFKLAYRTADNPEIKINILEYHYDTTKQEEEETLRIITGPARENTVDVIVTCNKGGESLHPENTVGLIICRKSNSEINVTQMLGRALQLKSICTDCKLIYDLVDNRDTISIKQNTLTDIVNNTKNIDNTTKIINKLQQKYGDIDTEILDSDMEEMIETLELKKSIVESLVVAHEINKVLIDNRDSNTTKSTHPITILSNTDNLELVEKFKQLQEDFITGKFGNYKIDEAPKDSIYTELCSMFGNYLYMTKDSLGENNIKISELVEIANKVKLYNYDYRNRISHTKQLSKDIENIRELNIAGKLSKSQKAFCYRNKIDIDGSYEDLIGKVFTTKDKEENKIMYKKYKEICKDLDKLDTSNQKEVLDVLSKEQIFNIRYSKGLGVEASNAIRITFEDKINTCRRHIQLDIYEKSAKLIKVLALVRSLQSREDSEELILKKISKPEELIIINLVKRNEQGTLYKYEEYILENLGITVFNAHRNAHINKLINSIPLGIYYHKFLETKSERYFLKLKEYNIDELPKFMKTLFRSKIYKEGLKSMEEQELLNTPNKNIQNIVMNLYYPKDEQIDNIRNAIKNKEVDSRNLLKYAIPQQIYSKYNRIFNRAMINKWSLLDINTQSIIDASLRDKGYSYMDIVVNLMNAGLIPEIQLEFAQHLIDIA